MIPNKKINIVHVLSLCFVLVYLPIIGQNRVLNDSILSIEELFMSVKNFHPLAVQANIQNSIADAEFLKAKGGFDPIYKSNLQQKNFEHKEYYSILSSELKIPTWPGIDIKSGYEQNRGVYLSPENTTPGGGLFYAGLSLSLGQGLFIDERRTGLKNAEILQKSAQARQTDLINELLFTASISYWDWFRAYNVLEIYRTSLRNAQERFAGVKYNVTSGDRPTIDTVEAKIQIQNILLGLNQANLDFRNTTTILSGYLWDEDNTNTGLPKEMKPNLSENELQLPENQDMGNELSQFISDHPYLEQLRQKTQQLHVEMRLKKDKLKPIVQLQYNPLSEVVGSNVFSSVSLNNYKWGMEFKMPLFLRKERGDVKITDFKIKENELILASKSQELFNKYQTYYNEWLATLEQLDLFEETLILYEQMFFAEKRLFEIGESSLFIVNAREQSYINAKIKYTELVAKNKISYYSLYYFAGKLSVLTN